MQWYAHFHLHYGFPAKPAKTSQVPTHHSVDRVRPGAVSKVKRVDGIEAFSQVRLNGIPVAASTQ